MGHAALAVEEQLRLDVLRHFKVEAYGALEQRDGPRSVCTKPYGHTAAISLKSAAWYSRPVWAKPGSVATVVSGKELKKNYDAPDWRRVTSSETTLCFLAQYTDKTHKVDVHVAH